MDIKNLTIEELSCGYSQNSLGYCCIDCGFKTDLGEVYAHKNRFYTAEGRMKLHIQEEHNGTLSILLQQPKRYSTLTDHQKAFIILLNKGYSDKEIANQLSVSESTVRHQRFTLREKEQQARLFLSIMTVLNQDTNSDLLDIHPTATQVDDRYIATKADEDKVKKEFFQTLDPLKLISIPRKEKYKIIVLRIICTRFEKEHLYSELEVNTILSDIYADFVTIRRYLIEYGFFQRDASCSQYEKLI